MVPLFSETSDFISTYRMFVENGRSGIMKRSGMDVDIASSSFKMPVYSVCLLFIIRNVSSQFMVYVANIYRRLIFGQ